MSPRIGSLCSGYGGLDMAVQEVFGGEIAWFFEYDKAPSKILAYHWPEIPNYGDMTKADWAGIEQVDILCGGTPCQDLSGAGKRKGMTEGTRSNLWVQMREAIAIQRPSVVVWENVRGAYSARADSEVEREPGLLGEDPTGPYLRALGRVLGDLSSLGYDSRVVPVRASDVGAPHGRYRVFVVAQDPHGADSDEWRIAASPEAEGGRAWADAGRRTSADPRGDESQRRGVREVMGGTTSADEGTSGERERLRHPVSDSDPTTRDSNYSGLEGRPLPTERASERIPGPDDLGASAWGRFGPAIYRWARILGRSAPAPTAADGKNNAHRLSPIAVEFMMGLALGHVTSPEIGLTRVEELKVLGNGVVVQQAAYGIRTAVSA